MSDGQSLALIRAVRCMIEKTDEKEEILRRIDKIIEALESSVISEVLDSLGLDWIQI